MRGAPQRGIRRGHAPDQSPERGVDGRATSGRAARGKRPVRAKATPLPPQDSVRSHDDEGLLPPGPDAGQPDPEEAITSAERWPGHRSFVHSELLTRPDSRGPAGGGRPRGRGEAEANGVRTQSSLSGLCSSCSCMVACSAWWWRVPPSRERIRWKATCGYALPKLQGEHAARVRSGIHAGSGRLKTSPAIDASWIATDSGAKKSS